MLDLHRYTDAQLLVLNATVCDLYATAVDAEAEDTIRVILSCVEAEMGQRHL